MDANWFQAFAALITAAATVWFGIHEHRVRTASAGPGGKAAAGNAPAGARQKASLLRMFYQLAFVVVFIYGAFPVFSYAAYRLGFSAGRFWLLKEEADTKDTASMANVDEATAGDVAPAMDIARYYDALDPYDRPLSALYPWYGYVVTTGKTATELLAASGTRLAAFEKAVAACRDADPTSDRSSTDARTALVEARQALTGFDKAYAPHWSDNVENLEPALEVGGGGPCEEPPPPANRWIQVFSSPELPSANKFAAGFQGKGNVSIVQFDNNWYAVVMGPFAEDVAKTNLETLVGSGAIPDDSFTVSEDKFVSVVSEDTNSPGRTIRDCSVCPEMVVVPAGSFTMGSPVDEPRRRANEGPRHKVTFARPFAVGRYEVTFDQWHACVAENGCKGIRPDDEGWGRTDRPVINVNWEQAKSYADWLSKRTGKRYRLLTEAEWEYAARAGTTTAYPTGKEITISQANFRSRGAPGRTKPVGSYPSNPFGLNDMSGNVWEWVADCWTDSYDNAPADGTAVTPAACRGRVLRGGSFYDNAGYLRSAARYWFKELTKEYYLGFRVARDVEG